LEHSYASSWKSKKKKNGAQKKETLEVNFFLILPLAIYGEGATDQLGRGWRESWEATVFREPSKKKDMCPVRFWT